MKFLPALFLSVLMLSGCSNAEETTIAEAPDDTVVANETDPTFGVELDTPDTISTDMDTDGKVLITVDRLIPEDAACLMMMTVMNGTDDTVTAGLFTFQVTGNGEETGANMFPQMAGPDEQLTAQIVLPGADCDDVQRVEGGQLNCKITETGESCVDLLELADGAVNFAINE